MESMDLSAHHKPGFLDLLGATSLTQRPSCRGWQAGIKPPILMRHLAADRLDSSLPPAHALHGTSHLSVS